MLSTITRRDVQVHYLAKRPPEDHTGVTLVLKPHAVPYAAGVVSYASWFSIPPGQKSHKIRNSCCFKSYQPLNMFAVRVHTHALGRRVYMEREKWDKSGETRGRDLHHGCGCGEWDT